MNDNIIRSDQINCIFNCLIEASNMYQTDFNIEKTVKICKLCDINCLSCTNTSKYCTECQADWYLHADNTCKEKCPDNYYPDTNLKL